MVGGGCDSDSRAWESTLFAEDDDAVITGDITFHEVLCDNVSDYRR